MPVSMDSDRIRAIAAEMREAENRYDRLVPNGSYLVARLDGRGFSLLSEARSKSGRTRFDSQFRDAFVIAACHLMKTGFNVTYAYTHSDEISLLFDAADDSFDHRYRKLLSVLAAEASAYLSLSSGLAVSMDCRLLELDSLESVLDYFEWRQTECPSWHPPGVALYHESMERDDAKNGIKTDMDLPNGVEYRRFLAARIATQQPA